MPQRRLVVPLMCDGVFVWWKIPKRATDDPLKEVILEVMGMSGIPMTATTSDSAV